jgi:hypothetical protein
VLVRHEPWGLTTVGSSEGWEHVMPLNPDDAALLADVTALALQFDRCGARGEADELHRLLDEALAQFAAGSPGHGRARLQARLTGAGPVQPEATTAPDVRRGDVIVVPDGDAQLSVTRALQHGCAQAKVPVWTLTPDGVERAWEQGLAFAAHALGDGAVIVHLPPLGLCHGVRDVADEARLNGGQPFYVVGPDERVPEKRFVPLVVTGQQHQLSFRASV